MSKSVSWMSKSESRSCYAMAAQNYNCFRNFITFSFQSCEQTVKNEAGWGRTQGWKAKKGQKNSSNRVLESVSCWRFCGGDCPKTMLTNNEILQSACFLMTLTFEMACFLTTTGNNFSTTCFLCCLSCLSCLCCLCCRFYFFDDNRDNIGQLVFYVVFVV